MKDLFDFGFTAVDESELDAVQQLETASDAVDDYLTRLDDLYNAIQPLLTNLKMIIYSPKYMNHQYFFHQNKCHQE